MVKKWKTKSKRTRTISAVISIRTVVLKLFQVVAPMLPSHNTAAYFSSCQIHPPQKSLSFIFFWCELSLPFPSVTSSSSSSPVHTIGRYCSFLGTTVSELLFLAHVSLVDQITNAENVQSHNNRQAFKYHVDGRGNCWRKVTEGLTWRTARTTVAK